VTFAHLTDPGRVRARNEDHLCAVEPAEDTLLARRGRLFVVADGMGGHARGELASRLAVDTVRAAYYDDGMPEELPQLLRLAVQRANEALYQESRRGEGGEPRMGTTLTMLVVREREAFVAHVGDSRAYLIRGWHIRQLTEDHSLVAEHVRQGVVNAAEAEHHPSAHVVLRALGASAEVPVELHGPLALRAGDTLVLCTDGLSRIVAAHEIRHLVRARPAPQACERLVALANDRGGPDNITLQVIQVGGRLRGFCAALTGAAAEWVATAWRWWPRAGYAGPTKPM
jgi:protein phosphatase